MLHGVEGVKPDQELPQKRKTDPSEVVERKKYEDTKRTRTFLPLENWRAVTDTFSLARYKIYK